MIRRPIRWGTGNPAPWSNPYYRPGDNLYTDNLIRWNLDSGKMNWFHQYTPGDMWDYDEVGTHIPIDGNAANERRKLITHSARNGFLYTMDRFNGQIIGAQPYLDNFNWTKGVEEDRHSRGPLVFCVIVGRPSATLSHRSAWQKTPRLQAYEVAAGRRA
jgi:glucose dehydrogenase